MKKVKDCMTTDVRVIDPGTSIREAARIMAEADTGALPVGENDRLIGMVTDRDIAIRAIAPGKDPETPVRDVMTSEVLYCFEDESVDHVAENMGDVQVRRLPVMNRQKRLVGIVSLSDLTRAAGTKKVGEALGEIARPGGQHTQAGGVTAH